MPELSHAAGQIISYLEMCQAWSASLQKGSWGIAFFEYSFQVPANRIGSYEFNAAQLKTIQEVITLTVFAVFSVTYLGEKLKWNYAAGAACLVLGVFFRFS